jgi:hypothetical protein
MKAEDTIVYFDGLINDDVEDAPIENALNQQAVISFKAGIKEVVEWLYTHNGGQNEYYNEWHEKLKEWGIER